MTVRAFASARDAVGCAMPPRYQPRPDGDAWAVADTRTGHVLARYPTEHAARCMARDIARAVRRAEQARRERTARTLALEFLDTL